jgi:hypothetical protein
MTMQRLLLESVNLGRNSDLSDLIGNQNEIPNTTKENRISADDGNDRL